MPNPNLRLAQSEDNWEHRSKGMLCSTCMYYVPKVSVGTEPGQPTATLPIGRCRRHAPSMNGWPVMKPSDWCGDHKLDEEKV